MGTYLHAYSTLPTESTYLYSIGTIKTIEVNNVSRSDYKKYSNWHCVLM